MCVCVYKTIYIYISLTLYFYWPTLVWNAVLSNLEFIGVESKFSSPILFKASLFLHEAYVYLKDPVKVFTTSLCTGLCYGELSHLLCEGDLRMITWYWFYCTV